MRERAPPKRNYEDEEWSKSESKKTALKILANLNRVFIFCCYINSAMQWMPVLVFRVANE